ncbi:DNA polymerase III subunit delta' [Pleionea sp. CnH1-48]|uniref:DNA polymerase III subunit delta' n=1 Tax=Pleionea sp. CnH1-48 TaxID=2954494 RepID=UPI0020985F59|nr:DNA polymerase III subunit delta' [Pleionea sp. CnH1-48]MCO7225873.1 DNA polymerase III subunit delta' [Pleionea sp. CnH1-48]
MQYFPWHQASHQRLAESYEQQRLPHGLLLIAREGSGSDIFARHWAAWLLCEAEQKPCGRCKSCQLIESQTHPDFHWLGIEEGKKSISIDQVRELTVKLKESASLNHWRVAVIYQAERLTVNGYNALLKTLEEPGGHTQLLLVAGDKSRIPATILSRCQLMDINAAQDQTTVNWLQQQCPQAKEEDVQLALALSYYAPLKAQAIIEQHLPQFFALTENLEAILRRQLPPMALAELKELDPESLLSWWDFLICQLLRKGIDGSYSQQYSLNRWFQLAEIVSEKLLFRLRDELLAVLKEVQSGVALNMPMQLDHLASQWMQCVKK